LASNDRNSLLEDVEDKGISKCTPVVTHGASVGTSLSSCATATQGTAQSHHQSLLVINI